MYISHTYLPEELFIRHCSALEAVIQSHKSFDRLQMVKSDLSVIIFRRCENRGRTARNLHHYVIDRRRQRMNSRETARTNKIGP